MAGALTAAILLAALALAALAAAPAEARLRDAVQFPAESFDFVTWDPVLKQTPNRGWRRWGTTKLVETTELVLRGYRDAHPDAPRVLVGDLSRRHGGWFGARYGGLGHASHQTGLDVDVYYPRLDGLERAARRPDQVDRVLAQELVDRFVELRRDQGLRRPARAPERAPQRRHPARLPRRPPPRPALTAPRERAGCGVGDSPTTGGESFMSRIAGLVVLAVLMALVAAFPAGAQVGAEPPKTPTAEGRGGSAATVDPLATQTAIDVLRSGGNAVDAAVAAAGVLGVTEPFSCGIGGGGFMVIYDAKRRKVDTIDSREAAPADLEPERSSRTRTPPSSPGAA